MLEIRPARQEDCPAAAALERECFSHPQSEESLRKLLTDGNARILTAWEDGAFCGYLCAYYLFDRAQLHTVAVSPSHRRKGVARALIALFFREGRERGCEAAELEVRSQNASALALYRSLGFLTVGLRKKYYRNPDDDAVLMDRLL